MLLSILNADALKRLNTAKEILSTEKAYVNYLEILIKVLLIFAIISFGNKSLQNYEQPFSQWISTTTNTSVTKDDIKNIFLNVSQILPLNQELLKR